MTVIEWLLDSDPAIRWQVMRDLTDAPADAVATERARVATDGWGAQVLALQGEDGYWGHDDPNPEWVTYRALLLLRDMGLDPTGPQARRAVTLVREKVTWKGRLPQDAAWHGRPLFAGEVEPCINGRVVSIGSYYGQDVTQVVDRLLTEQMADGGWNCEQENGSMRGSFGTTINVLEGLLAYDRANHGTAAVTAARERGEEYLLERRLLRRLSTAEVIDPVFTQFLFPSGWHYDVLRALDYCRSAGITLDERVAEAIGIVQAKRDADGRWLLENVQPDELFFDMGEREGQPSRWNTLRALRVLRWYGGRSGAGEQRIEGNRRDGQLDQ
jgi:hypothetical protein